MSLPIEKAKAAEGGCGSCVGAVDCGADSAPQASQETETESRETAAGRDAPKNNKRQSNSRVSRTPSVVESNEPDNKADIETPPDPFPRRIPAPEFPGDTTWINTGGPMRLRDLRGKFVLLDFWTYCCINCIHILPELKKLEHAYPNELVVIGVHSAKFETEKDSQNIREAVLRYEIEHPVINDFDHRIWNTYGVRSWPTMLLIDPEGNVVFGRSGEFTFQQINPIMEAGVAFYRHRGVLDDSPIRFDLLAYQQQSTPLRFPGKVLADQASDRLFIADSNHNRIVVTTLTGKLVELIGMGSIGRQDGGYNVATFNHPQGMFLSQSTLYVADTENHLIRKVELNSKTVTTIAGTGIQGRIAFPGSDGTVQDSASPNRWVGDPPNTAINSPWALWIHDEELFIAMAGPHQIWKMSLSRPEIGPYAGNGREDIVDGPLLPAEPYQLGSSSFAQPSGLASDGQWLFVADTEGSSIRAVPFDPAKHVRTIVGTSGLPHSRLFTFGDKDGRLDQALLQHAIGIAYHDGRIFVADTYNNKIKVIDLDQQTIATLAGTGQPGSSDQPAQFDEPAGLSYAAGKLYVADTNNHLIRVIDLENGGRVSALTIDGLGPPKRTKIDNRTRFANAKQQRLPAKRVRANRGHIRLSVNLSLPQGWKMNPLAPMRYLVEADNPQGALRFSDIGQLKPVSPPASSFEIQLPMEGTGSCQLKLSTNYFYCQTGAEGLCKVGSVTWTVPLAVAADAAESTVELRHSIKD